MYQLYIVQIYQVPMYIGPFTSTAHVPGRRALRSAGTNRRQPSFSGCRR